MSDTMTDSYFRQLCEHLGVAVIATDLDLNIRTWNASAARTFGAGADRMIGAPVSQIIPVDRRDMAERALRRALETGETIQFEFRHRDATGDQRELAGRKAPLRQKRVGADDHRIARALPGRVRDHARRRAGVADLVHHGDVVHAPKPRQVVNHFAERLLHEVQPLFERADALLRRVFLRARLALLSEDIQSQNQ